MFLLYHVYLCNSHLKLFGWPPSISVRLDFRPCTRDVHTRCSVQMLKFRWPTRCWETLQGKHDSRPLLEETALAIKHLGLVPMPPGSTLRLVFDELVAKTLSSEAVAHAQVMGARQALSLGSGDSHMHAAPPPVSVPPVAAGVLRDLQEGTLNGQSATVANVNAWGAAGAPPGVAAVAVAVAGMADSAHNRSPSGQHGEASSANSAIDADVSVVPLAGPWAPPAAAADREAQGNKRKAGLALAESPFAEACDPGVGW